MNYIGVDQSLTNTGIAIYSTDTNSIYFDSIPTTPKNEYWDRLNSISSIVAEYIDYFKPVKAYMELPMYCASHKSGRDLIRVETLIQYLFYSNDIPFVSISPKSWPKLLGLKTTKKELYDLLKPLASALTCNDQSDACGILIANLIVDDILSPDFDYLSLNYSLCPLTKLVPKAPRAKKASSKPFRSVV